jgi:sorbitol/mannitol transport system substrate-binding protein
MSSAPIDNPGTTKRPGLPGVQYVGVPEFQDVGNQCTQQFSAVIAGRGSVDSALSNCQQIASQAAGS